MKEDPNFNKIFWFIWYIVTVVLIYVFLITFVPIPKDNIRFVDTSIGFLLGTVLTGGIAYLLGGSPDKKKDIVPTGDNNTTLINNTIEPNGTDT